MSGIPMTMLIIFSAFTMNLMIQCGLGIKGIAESKKYCLITTVVKLGIIFVVVILLWLLFSRIIFSVFPGTLVYVLLFPVSFIVYEGFEFLFFQYISKKDTNEESFVNFPGGITAVAVFICINVANNFLETAVLSFGFTAGILLVFMIIREIRIRAALESVPRFIRGKPLVLITMGMLSLVFSVGSILLIRMIDIR